MLTKPNRPASPDSDLTHNPGTPASGKTLPETAVNDVAALQAKQVIQDLIKSGKAAVAVDGKLPQGATHEIVGTSPDGEPIVVRRRFY